MTASAGNWPTPARVSSAEQVRAVQEEAADHVTLRFLGRHPEWRTSFGRDDAAFDVDFVVASLAVGSAQPLISYVRWAQQVLTARGMSEDVLRENLVELRRVLGMLADKVAPQTNAVIDAALAALDEPAAVVLPLNSDAALFCDAVLAGQRTAALRVAREVLRRTGSVAEVYANVIEAAQYEIGRRWAADEISVADEHRATAIAQYVITKLYAGRNPNAPARGRVVIAGVPGERHELGSRIIADALDAEGWDVTFLGSDLPASEIVGSIVQRNPIVVGLSVALPTNVRALAELIEAIRSSPAGATARVVVGGRALATQPELWRQVGADAFAASVRDAVQTFGELSAASATAVA